MTGRRPRGMTLVETLVMLVLLGVFGSIAYPMFRSTITGIQRNQEHARQFEVGRTILRKMTTHLRQIRPLPGAETSTLTGTDGGTGAAAQDHLALTALDLSQLGSGTLFTVEYLVAAPIPSTGTPGRLVERLTAPDGTSREVAAGTNVVGLDCEYLAGGTWATEWAGAELPEAVRITVYVVQRPGGRPTAMRTEVNVPGGGG